MATQNILMPKLGESVTEGTIEKWLVNIGDTVNKYDPLAEVNTDKVNAEIPSSYSGVIKELIAKEGETLDVGAVVCVIETADESANEKEASADPSSIEVEPTRNLPEKRSSLNRVKGESGRYSPAVLRLAEKHNIDLALVAGTGGGGRITRKDLQLIVDSGNIPKATPQKVPQVSPKSSSAVDIPIATGDVVIPVTGIRRAIANNMLRSKQEAPHAWMMIEVDVTKLVTYRDSIKAEFKAEEGFNLTYFSFFVKAVAQALKEFPIMNSMWAGDKIIQKKNINISIAVAAEDLLFVPVIRHADEKTIKGIGRDIQELAKKARAGELTSADMKDGTFTVNNTGSFGSIQSMGIINYPQAAILQVESIVKKPVIVDGMVGVRDMVNLCLSLDHRVLDGLVCGRFLARVKEILENITAENTSIF